MVCYGMGKLGEVERKSMSGLQDWGHLGPQRLQGMQNREVLPEGLEEGALLAGQGPAGAGEAAGASKGPPGCQLPGAGSPSGSQNPAGLRASQA